jgi:cytoskeletal protein CcmA (bactofilin family)
MGLTAGTLNITGDSILNGNVTTGALNVTGVSYLQMGLTAGTLNVTGDSILNGTVTAGALYITGDTLLYGNVTAGALFVTGSSVLQSVTAASLMVNGRDITPSLGDICKEMTFYANNNQSVPDNITDFNFSNSTVRSFDAMVSVYIAVSGGGSDLYANYNLKGIQKSGYWVLNSTFIGDSTGVTFSITTNGQIQYISTNIANFVSDTMKFRALTTSVDII